jgi:hypothetical protein
MGKVRAASALDKSWELSIQRKLGGNQVVILERIRLINFTLASAFVLHMGMLAYDIFHPDLFLQADRAAMRLASAQGFLNTLGGGELAKYIASHGVVGDYVIQAMLFNLGGAPLIIITQILLTLLGGYGVYRVACLLGWNERLAVSACALFFLSPHSIVFPHQLASEALHTPLQVLSLWALAVCLARLECGRRAIWLLIFAALCTGLAALVRPVTLLWPLVAGLVILFVHRVKTGAVFLLVAYSPVVAWMVFIGLQTGKYGMGESSFDMPHNLYQRVWRISQTMSPTNENRVRQQFLSQEKGILNTGEYLRFGVEYPLPFLKHALRDMGMFIGKSGVERLTIDYLELRGADHKSLQQDTGGWRQRFEQEGALATIHYLWRSQGFVLALSVVGSLIMLVITFLAIVGGSSLFTQLRPNVQWQRGIVLLIVMLPLYVLFFSQVVNAMQSRHRAPAEGGLALLAVAGTACLSRHRSLLPAEDKK